MSAFADWPATRYDEWAASEGRPIWHLPRGTVGELWEEPGSGLAIAHFLSADIGQDLVCNEVLVQVVVPGMKAVDCGRIINVLSIAVRQPIKTSGH